MSACRLHSEPPLFDVQRKSGTCGLMGLPPELLVMVLARVRLRDLANLRQVASYFPLHRATIFLAVYLLSLQVCHRLRDMVDGPGGQRLWANVSLEGLAVDSTHLPLIEKYVFPLCCGAYHLFPWCLYTELPSLVTKRLS